MAEKKGAGGRPQEYDTQTGEYSNLPSAKNLVRNYERRFGEIKQAKNGGKAYDSKNDFATIAKRVKKARGNVELSPQEWAMFYERFGKIKKEGHYIFKTKKGEMIIPIETGKSNVVVIASGTYETPKVKHAIRCKSNDYMYEIIERLKNL